MGTLNSSNEIDIVLRRKLWVLDATDYSGPVKSISEAKLKTSKDFLVLLSGSYYIIETRSNCQFCKTQGGIHKHIGLFCSESAVLF